MNEWTNNTLGGISSIITGPFGSQLHAYEYVESGIPVIMPQNIEDRAFSTEKVAYVDNETANRLRRYATKEYDIVYSRRGDIEKHAFIVKNQNGALCGTGCFRIRIINKSIFPMFLSFYLNRPETKKWLVQHAVGSNMPNLNAEILAEVPIAYPKLSTQQAISGILESIDRKIALNNRINAELEKTAKLLYDYWFVQFDFPNAEGKPYRASGGEMVYNEQLKREIPKGWRIDKLGSKLNLQRGVEPGSNAYSEAKTDTQSVPFIRVSDLGKNPTLYISEQAATGIHCIPSDVLVSFDGTIGKMAVAMEGAYSSGVRKIFPKDSDYSSGLIYWIFQSEEIQKTISKYAVGSNILHAAGAIEHLMFPYHSETTTTFIRKIEPIYKQIIANHQQNKELTTLRDFLLPLLMNGQVTVDTCTTIERKGELS